MDELQKIKDKVDLNKEHNENGYTSKILKEYNIDWLIEQIEELQAENGRYKDINQGLLDVQISLRDKEREYQQWFEVASSNIQRKEKVIENQLEMIKELEKEIDGYEHGGICAGNCR